MQAYGAARNRRSSFDDELERAATAIEIEAQAPSTLYRGSDLPRDSKLLPPLHQNARSGTGSRSGSKQRTPRKLLQDFYAPYFSSNEEGTDLADDDAIIEIDGLNMPVGGYINHPDFEAQIADVERPSEAVAPPAGMHRELRPWQRTGISRLNAMGKSPRRGGILGDQMGLGKTALTVAYCQADRINRRRLGEPVSHTLVVCPKSCRSQWYKEIIYSFTEKDRPKTLILQDPNKTAQDLVTEQWDFVIITHAFMENRYREWTFNSADQSVEGARGRPVTGANNCLFSEYYHQISLPIQHVIIDEAHVVKKPNGNTHAAVKNLYFDEIFLLTGTFLPNRWYNVFGLMTLIPGHPFRSIKNFCEAFASKDGTGRTYARLPQEGGRSRLIKFLRCMVVARPGALLELEAIRIQNFYFCIDDKTSGDVDFCSEMFINNLREPGKGGRSIPIVADLDRSSNKAAALGYASTAQMLAAHADLLCPGFVRVPKSKLAGLLRHDPSSAPNATASDAYRRVYSTLPTRPAPTATQSYGPTVSSFTNQRRDPRMPAGLFDPASIEPYQQQPATAHVRSTGNTPTDQASSQLLRKLYGLRAKQQMKLSQHGSINDLLEQRRRVLRLEILRERTHRSSDEDLEGSDTDMTDIVDPDADIDYEFYQLFNNDGLYLADEDVKDEELLEDDEAEDSAIDNIELPVDDEGPSLGDYAGRPSWLEDLSVIPFQQLLSPKIQAILQLLNLIFEECPHEKVVIFSAYLRFLDILDAAICKDPLWQQRNVIPIRFDGTTKDADRELRRSKFEDQETWAPILITAGAGGSGMNLTAATQVIQCEPWWNSNDELQAYARAWRQGQTHRVRVWRITCVNSSMEITIKRSNGEKRVINDEITDALRKEDPV
ncbi:hypothetical protein CAC42_4749 [Sphaceloma murrayae]|uniref:Uncharacterized protein n=1 Tax=Sphaceloma murrayae TaxID=2082308 RepID=A0A2K1QNU8_9PEZI|nr:hypothetical protein CAC42_4749 [Sphaceloma murrayae]